MNLKRKKKKDKLERKRCDILGYINGEDILGTLEGKKKVGRGAILAWWVYVRVKRIGERQTLLKSYVCTYVDCR